MKGTAVIISLAIITGFAAGRLGRGASDDETSMPAAVGIEAQKPRPRGEAAGGGVAVPELIRLKTSEDLESVVALGDGLSYADLALWLLEADAGEIAEYWRRYSAGTPTTDKKRLLFFNWTRVDPQGALAAAAGTDDANLVLWAWAASDPAAALAAARTPEDYKRAAKGIGEFQPDWLKESFAAIPEDAQREALNGLTTWRETDDHAGMMDFLRENGRGFNEYVFKAFALKDPWGAYDWLEKNRMLAPSRYSSHEGPLEIFIAGMKSAHSDDLERMANMTPPGKMKRTLEDAVFDNLMTTDPERALKMANAHESPLMAASMLSKIASRALLTEPGKAFEIAGDILMKNKDGLAPTTKVLSPRGWSSSSSVDSDTSRLFGELMAKDPARVLDMAATAAHDSPGDTFGSLARSWANTDTAAYAAWVNRQSAPPIRGPAIQQLVSQLVQKGSFHEAADWAVASPAPEHSLRSLAWSWGRSDPEQAKAWFQEADLPAKDRQQYLDQVEQMNR